MRISSPIDEIQIFVDAGLSNFDALRAATIAPAEMLGIGGQMGTVAVGKTANLILIEGNPLENIDALRELTGVMLHGGWHSSADLEKRLVAQVTEFATREPAN